MVINKTNRRCKVRPKSLYRGSPVNENKYTNFVEN